MKLVHKLTLAFVLISLTAIGLAALFIGGTISYEFNRYLTNQRQNDFVTAVTAYYENNASWNGVDVYLRENQLLPPLGEVNPPPQPYILADADREVIVASAPYVLGEKVKKGEMDKGVPIVANGQIVGTVISTGQPLVRKPVDQKYIDQINQALWIAGLGGVVIALILGVFIARSLTRPLREITDATHEMAQGRLAQQVPVRSKDELGELAQSFNQMSADLSRANQSRRQMTADIAHDLRNPLTVIGGYLESLQEGKLQPTPEQFAVMQSEVQQLQRLVEDLRTLSLADSGELKLHLAPIKPAELLRRVLKAYCNQAEQRMIKIKIEAEPNLRVIELDPERMEQVLGNLVSNALRFTSKGGEIFLTAKQIEENLTLSVQDNGSGIPPEILPHIFERSFRGDSSRSGDESGLGLAIARSIVELHGGSIQVESRPGEGSRFIITIPIN
jgi:two-component system, OmpR family, sensor histidine kinase BaeS